MPSLCKLEDFASTFAPYIDELHDFFSSRGVEFGSAEDVPAVVERVAGDEVFRDEMASMVRAIIYQGRDGLAPIELFELMVVAIGGPQVDEAGEEIRGPAAQLLAFVRGVCHSRWKTDVDAHGNFEAIGETVDPPSAGSAELEEPGRGLEWKEETTGVEETRGGMDEVETASASVEPNVSVESTAIKEMHSSSALFYRARVVAAARHEPEWSVGAEVAAEQLAVRVEPAEVAEVAEVGVPVEPIARSAEATPVWARQRFVAAWRTVNWPTITWPTIRWPTINWPSVRWPSARWPTLGWANGVVSGSRRWTWGVGLCALGVVVGAGLWLHDSGGAARSVRGVERASAALAADQKRSPAVKNLRDEEVVAMISAAEQRGRDSVGDQAEDLDLAGGSEEPAVQDEPHEGRSQKGRSQAGQQQERRSALISEPEVEPAQTEAAPVAAASAPRPAAPKESFAQPTGRAGAARYGVSPGLMESRLLYAPKLEYPMLAKLARVEGKVVVQAVVGRDGWVAAANVLSGHRLLRGAALTEVRRRHYRPYIVNDRRTEVTTIVTVDFRLR